MQMVLQGKVSRKRKHESLSDCMRHIKILIKKKVLPRLKKEVTWTPKLSRRNFFLATPKVPQQNRPLIQALFRRHTIKVLKVPKLSQTKVFDKKSGNFWRPGVGPVEKRRFLAFSRVSCHFGSYLLNYQI